MQFNEISRDKNAASTELGYVFTFLVGVMLLTMFSIWTLELKLPQENVGILPQLMQILPI